MHLIVIDGIEYVPRNTVIPDRIIKLLAEVAAALWSEGHYDPLNESTGNFARPLSDKMSEVNAVLKFKK